MRRLFLSAIVVFGISLCPQRAATQTSTLPAPRPLPILDDDRRPISTNDFEQLINKLRDERNALDAEWRELAKRGNLRKAPANDDALNRMIVDITGKLKPGPAAPAYQPTPQPHAPEPPETPKEAPKKSVTPAQPTPEKVQKPAMVADPIGLGQTLFRAGMYADALAALDKVEIVGMTPEARAPILYFKACCNAHLGNSAKAVALFEDVVKVRGDERLVDYARWQLEELHWHRNVSNTLQDIRKRLKAMEKLK